MSLGMLGPYRNTLPINPEALPDRCVPLVTCEPRCPPRAPKRSVGSRVATASGHALLVLASMTLGASGAVLAHTAARAPFGPRLHSVAPMAMRHVEADAPRFALAAMGPATHDADALWARAERVAQRQRLTLVRASLGDAPPRATTPTRVIPEPGRRAGLRIIEGGPGSNAELLGLRPGDVLTAVNGFSLRGPEDAASALAAAQPGKIAVIELVRGGRAFAIRVAHS